MPAVVETPETTTQTAPAPQTPATPENAGTLHTPESNGTPKAKPKKAAKAAAAPAKAEGKTAPAKAAGKKAATPGKKAGQTDAQKRRVAVVKAMKKLGAYTKTSARTTEEIGKAAGLDRREVYGVLAGLSGKAGSSPTCLMALGLADTCEPAEGRGVAAFLTKKGQAADLSAAPFA